MLHEEVERLLQELRARPTERADIEAKASRSDCPTEGWQTITAFANSSGGMFLLGVRDATFEAVGVANPVGAPRGAARIQEKQGPSRWRVS